jgi:hypothetical protein
MSLLGRGESDGVEAVGDRRGRAALVAATVTATVVGSGGQIV